MSITATNGPYVSFGITVTSSGAAGDYNPDRGPSIFDLGTALADPRPPFAYNPGQGATHAFYSWAAPGPVVAIDAIPTTAETSGIVPNTSAAPGKSFTLTSTAASSSFTATSIIPATGTAAVSVLALDGAMGGLSYGSGASVNVWDPTKAVSRCVSIFSSTNTDNAQSVTISGYDLYGYAMSEALNPSSTGNGVTVYGKKAFKYISTVTCTTGTWNSTHIRVGTTDIFGLPLRVDNGAYLQAWWGPSSCPTQVVSSANEALSFVPGSTAAATTTTGDVRGTICTTGLPSGVSNSTTAPYKRLTVFITPSPSNLATLTSNNWDGLVGVSQA